MKANYATRRLLSDLYHVTEVLTAHVVRRQSENLLEQSEQRSCCGKKAWCQTKHLALVNILLPIMTYCDNSPQLNAASEGCSCLRF